MESPPTLTCAQAEPGTQQTLNGLNSSEHAYLGWHAEDATAPFAITVPSATAAPGTLVKFRDR
jgi:hypothetical protein